MDQDLITYLDRRFDDLSRNVREQIDGTNARIDETHRSLGERIDETNARIDETQRSLGERIDETNHKMEAGFAKVDEKIRHTHVIVEDLRGKIELVVEGLESVRQRQVLDKQELREEIREVRTFVQVTYTDLHQRVRILEER